MKLRTGFVSNSSSSSFIIGYNNKEQLKTSITIDVDLSKYVETIISNEKELFDYFDEVHTEYDTIEEYKSNKIYKKYFNVLNNNKKIAILRFSDYEETTETALKYLAPVIKFKDMDIIERY